MQTRREFIKTACAGLAVTTVPNVFNLSAAMSKHHVAVQLYTLRDDLEKDFNGTLKRLAALGIKNVETAFWPKTISVETAAAALKTHGFKVTSSHVDIPTKENIKTLADAAKAYGTDRLIWHGWPEDKRYSSLEGTKELAKIYNESSKLAKDHGLRFGLHNHWWEYRNHVGGKLVYEVLNEELSNDIFFETDVYWVKVAGHNPADILKKLKNRVQLIHIKDGPAVFNEKLIKDEPDPMSPVGRGALDVPSIIEACSDKVEWLVIELDKSAIDVYEALKQSKQYLSKFKSVSLA